MRNTIMTEKIVRRGVRVPGEYAADFLDQVTAGACGSKPVVTLRGDDLLDAVRGFIGGGKTGSSHQGFPLVDAEGALIGVLTRRDLLDPARPGTARLRDLIHRPLAVVFADSSLREAADHMLQEGVGRLPVVTREEPRKAIGILTRSDLIAAHRRRLEETHVAELSLNWRGGPANGKSR